MREVDNVVVPRPTLATKMACLGLLFPGSSTWDIEVRCALRCLYVVCRLKNIFREGHGFHGGIVQRRRFRFKPETPGWQLEGESSESGSLGRKTEM